MSGEPSLEGRCLCGDVRFALTGEPVFMGYCHCESCRRWIGGPIHASSLWPDASVRVRRGSQRIATFKRTPSTGSLRQFCTGCGTPVMIRHPAISMTDVPALAIPGLAFAPTAHTHYQESVLPVRDGLPKFKEFAPSVGGSLETLPE